MHTCCCYSTLWSFSLRFREHEESAYIYWNRVINPVDRDVETHIFGIAYVECWNACVFLVFVYLVAYKNKRWNFNPKMSLARLFLFRFVFIKMDFILFINSQRMQYLNSSKSSMVPLSYYFVCEQISKLCLYIVGRALCLLHESHFVHQTVN